MGERPGRAIRSVEEGSVEARSLQLVVLEERNTHGSEGRYKRELVHCPANIRAQEPSVNSQFCPARSDVLTRHMRKAHRTALSGAEEEGFSLLHSPEVSHIVLLCCVFSETFLGPCPTATSSKVGTSVTIAAPRDVMSAGYSCDQISFQVTHPRCKTLEIVVRMWRMSAEMQEEAGIRGLR